GLRGCPLPGVAPGHGPQRFLADVVLEGAAVGVDPVDGAEVDDPPPATGLEVGKGRLHGPEAGPDVHVETVPHLGVGLVLGAAEGAAAPGVVHQDIDAATVVNGPVHHGEHLGLVPHIGG